MLTCKRARRLIVRTIDDETLSAEARALLRQHLAWCVRCRDEYETQHEVRRVLALQIECRPRAGFAERLNARLARLPDRQPGSPAPTAPPACWEVALTWRRETRWRTWGLRMLSAAATLALTVAGAHVHDLNTRLASQSGAPLVAPSAEVRSSKEMGSSVPPLTDAARPHRGKEPLSTDFVVLSRAPTARPTVDRGDDPPRATVDSDPRVGIVPISPITLPAVSASEVELGAVPAKLAPELAEELQLSDTQRKKIEAIYDMRQHALDEILDSTRKRVELERDQTLAAVERVLTPNQRKQYRERCASQESSFATRQAVPLPPAHRPVPQQAGSAVCRE